MWQIASRVIFGRQLRTTLPNVQHHQNAKLKETKTKKYYDQSAKPLKSLPTNALVRLYSNRSWKQKATVLEEVSLHSYNVQTGDGVIYRRNLKHLLRIADTQPMNMTSESTPNVNQQD